MVWFCPVDQTRESRTVAGQRKRSEKPDMDGLRRRVSTRAKAFRAHGLLAHGLLALTLAMVPGVGSHAATWTYTPELRRLDSDGNELPTGHIDVERNGILRIGLYVTVSADGAAPTDEAVLGFESFLGAIHFSSDEMGPADIAAIVRSLREGRGWDRRMANTSFEPAADGWLGPAGELDNETSWISLWSDPTNAQGEQRGAWCAADGGACRIFAGVLSVPVSELPLDASGNLSLHFGSVSSPDLPAELGSMFGRADESVLNGNTITYGICPASGCATLADADEGPDRESRAVAMKYALAGFGRAVGGNVIEMIGQRASMRDIELVETYVAIGGRMLDLNELGFGEGSNGGLSGWVNTALDFAGIDVDSDHGLFWEAAQAAGISSGRLNLDLLPDADDLLRGSSFEMPLGGGSNGAPSRWTLWGVGGDMSAFQGRPEDRFSMDGEVFAGHMGLDYRVNDTLLAGTIVSHSSGEVDYRFSGPAGDDGGIRMELASAHPYAHWAPLPGLTVWGSVGFGRGSATLADDKGEADTDISMRMLAVGSRRELMSVGRVDLAMKADAFLVQMQSAEREYLHGVVADTSRVRLALEGSRSFEFANGSSLTGSLEVGGLADGGDAETGAGAELGAGFTYMHPAGLGVQARGHVLLTHEDSEFEQWGAGLTVNFDRGTPGEGLFFSFAPTWGTPSTGAEGMWTSTRATQALLATGSAQLGMNMDTQVGYGLNLPSGKGLLTLVSEVGKPSGGPSRLRLGTRLGRLRTNGSRLDLELLGERISPILEEDPAYGILLNARGRF